MDNITPTHIIIFLGVLVGLAIAAKIFALFAEKREVDNMKYRPLVRENVKILQVDKIDVLNVRRAKVLIEDNAGHRLMLQYKGEPTFVVGDVGMVARQGDYILSFTAKQEGEA